MAGTCSKEDCYPLETGCNHEGCNILTECKYYSHTEQPKENTIEEEDEFYIRIPWTGNAFGLKDLNFLGSSSPVTLIGISGVASAGKTTFLATLYCLLRNGHKVGDYTFSGSLTLIGWENIAWYLSWKQHNNIQFPPHTSSNSGRIPGMLHLSLRNPNGDKKELVFTDAPGEWFDHWTTNSKDPNAKGANWIHEFADAFLLFADCEMLSGTQLGRARQQTKAVADRLKQGLDSRPFGLIWSKSDIQIDTDIKHQISNHIQNSHIEHYKEFETSVRNEGDKKFQENILNSIHWIITTRSDQNNILPEIVRIDSNDLFLSKR
ncbi:hypothetical protein [Fluviicola sp.]|uniref:TRAFAC clade GTPase domain-containing protein n=1 Tax=Fluviicola sp. TaxID=1917219 RepID=UPI0031DBD55A